MAWCSGRGTIPPSVRVEYCQMAAAKRLALTVAHRPSLQITATGVILAVTLPFAYVLNLWQDEAYTLQTTSGDLGYAFHQAITFEQNAPLYFMLLTLWRHINGSIFFLRLFSVVCAAATALLLPGLARRYLSYVNPALPTFAVAWNPFFIWAALEMRAYALIILISAAMLLTFFDAFLAERPRWDATVAYAACVSIGLYTQYYLAFLVLAQAVTVLLYRPRAFARFTAAGAAGALAFLPMLLVVASQVQNFRGGFTPPASVLASSFVLAGILARYVLPLHVPHASAFYAALGAGAVVVAIAKRRAFTTNGNGTILVTGALAFVAFSVGVYAGGVHILTRHAAYLYVLAVLSVFAALTFITPTLRRRSTTAWFALALIASSIALVQTYASLSKAGDWSRVSAYISAREHANEPIAVFEAENALPLAYYYHGPNRIVAIPHAVDFRNYDVTRFVVHNEAELAAAMPRPNHLWLITAGQCRSANITFGCDIVDHFVAARYRVDADATFHGSRARLLRLREANH